MSAPTFPGWAPVERREVDVVTAGAAEAMHGLLDAPGPAPAAGEALPPLWHWMAFLPRVPQAELGDDGHPRRGGFLPPVPLPRRMFAGATLQLPSDLRVGEPIHRRAEVTGVEEKRGRSGALVFVTVRHELAVDGHAAVTEVQDIVYREADAPGGGGGSGGGSRGGSAPLPEPDLVAGEWPWNWDLGVDPTLLFRFSALTYNAHRIHYDREYATRVEGYPGLVVHGPLQAVALAELCRRHVPHRPLRGFRFRALRPAFDDGPVLLRGRPDGDGVALAAFDAAGRRTMEATATLR